MSGDKKVDTKNRELFCPRDHQKMNETRKNNAFIDMCPKCSGMFFDQGEMFAACGHRADQSFWDREGTAGPLDESPIHCARCDGHMHLQKLTQENIEVEIDRCAHCGGIWLDGGEIEKILAIGEKLQPMIDAEVQKAKDDLKNFNPDDARPPGLIASFLGLFGVGKKKPATT